MYGKQSFTSLNFCWYFSLKREKGGLLRHCVLCLFQRLVVCLEESIYIHNIKDMKLLKTLLNTPSNSSGMRETCEGISIHCDPLWSLVNTTSIVKLCRKFWKYTNKIFLHNLLFHIPGLCALSINHSNSYVAYPGSATIGEIIVYDANSLVRKHLPNA